jgi:hypothetical protein
MSDYVIWVDRADYPAKHSVRLDFVEGNGVAEQVDAQAHSFLPALATLDGLIAANEITPQDLKCRFDGCSVGVEDEDVVFTIRIGPTHYFACRKDMDDPAAVTQKVALGLEHFQDAKHYLTCGMGVVVVPYTSSGHVVLGLRDGIDYDGWWNGVSGWLPFTRNLKDFDPVSHARLECREELGILEQQQGPLEFLGVVSYQSSYETDLVFSMHLSDESAALLVEKQLWKAAQDAYEHSRVELFCPQEVLLSKQKLMPSTQFGLNVLNARRNDVE